MYTIWDATHLVQEIGLHVRLLAYYYNYYYYHTKVGLQLKTHMYRVQNNMATLSSQRAMYVLL